MSARLKKGIPSKTNPGRSWEQAEAVHMDAERTTAPEGNEQSVSA